ncbi:BA14K family protein [Rhizobiaceae bacterium n13]|uniref:Lectin-like protein BA14k n=1 Tax=Ferirhizobium litorale TaxID=2927786 RepID=A0AAE3U311_9HYPH|nr:BA14K family protein [Fererhizobium litorale]MDI7861468.1 BA14K family protein [Fererhizobium litorale]MDI7921614.1 BA14K family protein [Fererhizobium litorale]
MKTLATIALSLAFLLPEATTVGALPFPAVVENGATNLERVNHQSHGRDDYYDDPNQTGWFFGMIVTGTLFDPDRALPTYTAPHTWWCIRRYRSYRQDDNTFKPTRGPRQTCVSPYSQ